MGYLRSYLQLSPFKITVSYCLFGVIWIPTTDFVLATIFESQRMPTALGVLKGWTFIALSSLLLFSLSRLHHRQMATAQTRLQTTNQQLQVLHRVFRHNIRNDLNVIHGYTNLAADRIDDEVALSQLEMVEHTAEQIARVSDKLNVVKQVDPTISNEETVDLVALINQELDRLEAAQPEITIVKDLPEQAWIQGGESIQYAIREVLENAVTHYDGPLSDCRLSINATQTGDNIALEITDNGPGIPDDELTAVQSQEESPLDHASSVGLWLVMWLCRLHGGTAEFTAEAGAGTTVFFEFETATSMSVFGIRFSRFEPVKAINRS